MLATYHVVCAFPGCGHTAVVKDTFDWPMAPAPEAPIPPGWSVVMRRIDDQVSTLAVCGRHDFCFDGVKASDIRQVGFTAAKEDAER
jgi:hypothetical protein